MSANDRNVRTALSHPVGSPLQESESLIKYVRLSHLHKLRECEQVAAICYRIRSGSIEFLLVRTRSNGRWTFPKGSTEPGLTHAQAAALEAFEEAGVHGRIEEISFACYVCRKGSANSKSANGAPKELTVRAHLCEVVRLAKPKESSRNRTWFSVAETRQRLREGRDSYDAMQCVRVVDKAVGRIPRRNGELPAVDARPLWQQQKDELQKVQFESAITVGSFPPLSRVDDVQRTIGLGKETQRLQCEVLQFGTSQEINPDPRWLSSGKKPKALGTGAKNG